MPSINHDRAHLRASCDPVAKAVVFGMPALALVVAFMSLAGPQAARAEAPAPSSGLAADTRTSTIKGISECTSCHQASETGGHPIDVVPKMKVPGSLPLTADKVTCTTCHDPQSARGHDTRRTSGNMFLRTEGQATSLCAQCHTQTAKRSNPHASNSVKVHTARMSRGTTGLRLAGGSQSLDTETRSCMACHDGSLAGDAGTHTGVSMNYKASSEHPIGVRYQNRTSAGGEPIVLHPMRTLDKRVRLFDEKIGCGSCHNVYSGERKLLVMDNRGSRLCLSCHVE